MVGVRRRASVAVAAALLVVGWVGAVTVPAAPRATGSTAGITVDFGNGTITRRTVTFSESSISGLDALRRAGFTVDVYGFGGIGAAVCRIDGVGRAPDASCLSGGAEYWGYWRNGTYSPVGAGSTAVHPHDQEQWKWGTGGNPPPTTAFGPPATRPPATTRPATTRPATTRPATVTTRSGGATVPTGPSGPGSTAAPSGATTTIVAGSTTRPNGPTTSTTVSPGGATTVGGSGPSTPGAAADGSGGGASEAASGEATPASSTGTGDGGGGGGPPWGLAAFAVVLAVVVGFTVRARRARPAD